MKLKTCWSENTFLSLGEHQEGGSQQDFWPDMGAEWKGKTVFVINDDGNGDGVSEFEREDPNFRVQDEVQLPDNEIADPVKVSLSSSWSSSS